MNRLIQWATGAGKTKEALDLISSFDIPIPQILILVAERQHIDNWKAEMKKWNFILADNTTIMCYASLKKVRNTKWDFLVLDECHHIISVKRQQCLRTIKADHVFALSATPGYSEEVLNNLFGEFEQSYKSLGGLIVEGRLPKPEIFIYGLTLDNLSYDGRPSERTLYDAVNNRIKQHQITFARNNKDAEKFKMYQAGLERKRLLGSMKMPYVSYLLEKIWDKRYICFCPTIDIAQELYTAHPLGSACIHSKASKKTNDQNIKDFNEGNLDHLFVVGMLTEGTNLTDIEAGVLIQLDKGERTMIQKLGRTLRAEHPKMYFFRFKDTVDDELTKNITNSIDSQYVREVDFPRTLLLNKKGNNYERLYRT